MYQGQLWALAREQLSIEKLYGKDCEYNKKFARGADGGARVLVGSWPGRIRRAPALRRSHDVAGAIYARRGHASR
jgi:hypothetical protein